MKDKRFITVYSKSKLMTGDEIIVDRETGVNYYFHYSGYSSGLTPLLGADGKPVVTPIEEESDGKPVLRDK